MIAPSRRWPASWLGPLSLVAILAVAPPAGAQFANVRVQVIDVGQGDAELIRTPNSRWILIDAGEDGLLGDSLRSQFGVDSLTLVIGSHRHYDHVGGMDEVLRAVPAGELIWDTTQVSSRAFDDSVRAVATREGIRIVTAGPDTIDVDGVRFIILPPAPREPFGDENDNSIVVRMEYGDFSMLFPGDAEEEERDWLVANHSELLAATVLKAAHHGSRNGTDSTWLATVKPQDVVISAGVSKVYKHPHPEAVAAYDSVTNGRLFCTNREGTIRIYGSRTGRVWIHRQLANDKSCVCDETHY